jgi:hypothetical protein
MIVDKGWNYHTSLSKYTPPVFGTFVSYLKYKTAKKEGGVL